MKGTVKVLTDPTRKKMVWMPGYTMSYKEEIIDPDYCVLKFTAFSGRYYGEFKSDDLFFYQPLAYPEISLYPCKPYSNLFGNYWIVATPH